MGWVLNETDYICCFALFCTCQYNKLIELEPPHFHFRKLNNNGFYPPPPPQRVTDLPFRVHTA